MSYSLHHNLLGFCEKTAQGLEEESRILVFVALDLGRKTGEMMFYILSQKDILLVNLE